MALILAIEPDRRQAGQLSAMVKGRLHAEVVIGDSAETALAALGERVPDLVLTTALLSPKDESALSERLRALDGAAAHVQTLTIPVLATPARNRVAAKAGGMLSALLGDKARTPEPSTAEGCDPAMFAEQCREYLERAAAERANAAEDLQAFAATSAVVAEPEIPEIPGINAESEEASQAVAESMDALPDEFADLAGAPEPEATTAEPAASFEMPEPVVVAAPRAAHESRGFIAHLNDDEPPAGLLAAVAALADEDDPAQELVAEAPVPAAFVREAMPVEPVVEEPVEPVVAVTPAINETDNEPDVPVYSLDAPDGDDAAQLSEFAAAVAEVDTPAAADEAASVAAPRPDVRTWPILDELAAPADAADQQPAMATQPAAESARTEHDDLRDWQDIIEALRRDAEPAAAASTWSSTPAATVQQTEDVEPPEDVTNSALQADSAALQPSETPAPENKREEMAEDEWGFFDPDRAGFAALLAKLEQITEDDARKPQRT